jgi:hypothetical protein
MSAVHSKTLRSTYPTFPKLNVGFAARPTDAKVNVDLLMTRGNRATVIRKTGTAEYVGTARAAHPNTAGCDLLGARYARPMRHATWARYPMGPSRFDVAKATM